MAVWVLSCGEDGDKKLDRMTKADLCDRLEENWWGSDVRIAQPNEKIDLDRFVGIIIIDGDIVVPKAVEKVTRYTL